MVRMDSGAEQTWTEYLRRAAEGDSRALASLYDETSALVYSIARRILGNTADAEEVTVDVYTYVWRSAATYDPGRGTVCTWLTMLTRSRALGRLRRATGTHEGDAGRIDESTAVHSPHFGEERILVEHALQQLPPGHRELLELAYFSGLSHQELASKLNLPLGTVKDRIRAAISRLRDLLGVRPA